MLINPSSDVAYALSISLEDYRCGTTLELLLSSPPILKNHSKEDILCQTEGGRSCFQSGKILRKIGNQEEVLEKTIAWLAPLCFDSP